MYKGSYIADLDEIAQFSHEEIRSFVQNNKVNSQIKSDGTIVTDADQHLNDLLVKECQRFALPIVSEEAQNSIEHVRAGSYVTIDPIDGTSNFAYHLKTLDTYPNLQLPDRSNHGLLIGIVVDGVAIAGIMHNYVNGDNIIVDVTRKTLYVNLSDDSAPALDAVYTGSSDAPDIFEGHQYKKGGYGLRTAECLVKPHKNAVAYGKIKSAGIWDIMPAAALVNVIDAQILCNDDPLSLTQYIYLPKGDCAVIKGEKYLEAYKKRNSN